MWLRGRVAKSEDEEGKTITVELIDIGKPDRLTLASAPREDDAVYVLRLPYGGDDAVDDLYVQVTSLPMTDFLKFHKKIQDVLAGREEE
jgi:hypothetical protein